MLFFIQLSPEKVYLAVEGPDDHLPGLRWTELKQLAICLSRHWRGDFDASAIISLLYPLIQYIPFDEFEDVRQTLAAAWQDLQVLDPLQTEQWLDEIITVYDKGRILRINAQKEWKQSYIEPGSNEGDFWIQTEEGWKTIGYTSLRNIQKDVRPFIPFFSMLEQYA